MASDITELQGELSNAFIPLQEAFINLGQAIAAAFGPIFEKLGLINRAIQPSFTVTQRLDWFGLYNVDPNELTPDERWEYQRWVWGAPVRWVRKLFHKPNHEPEWVMSNLNARCPECERSLRKSRLKTWKERML